MHYLWFKKVRLAIPLLNNCTFSLHMDWIVAGRFEIHHKLGSGTYGDIYLGVDVQNGQEVALKFERAPAPHPQLHTESQAYSHLSGSVGIPPLIWLGLERNFTILVIERLGRSLEDWLHLRRRPFSLHTILMLADQSLRRLEFVHRKCLLHRDIKPSNILVGMGCKETTLYVIDFGLSKFYCDQETGKHIPMSHVKDLIGTARFASTHVMRGLHGSRRDDLISLGYVWVYLFKGALPWQTLEVDDERGTLRAICDMKLSTSLEELCAGMPLVFVRYFEIVLGLGFEDEPPYSILRALFLDFFTENQFLYDLNWDWLQSAPAQQKVVRRFSLAVVRIPPCEKPAQRAAVLRPELESKPPKRDSLSPLTPPEERKTAVPLELRPLPLPPEQPAQIQGGKSPNPERRTVRLASDEGPLPPRPCTIRVTELRKPGILVIPGRRQSFSVLAPKISVG
jgi:serine/threonine protein kinase